MVQRMSVLATMFLLVTAADAQVPRLELKVMTYNIRTMSIPDGRDNWYLRRSQVAKLIARERPDLFGLQEAYTAQAAYLARRLPDYEWFGPGRDNGKSLGERCPIFYRRDRFELVAHGAFWLSETPDRPSRSWDAAFPRLVTWGKFRERASGRELVYLNTHFDHLGEKAREMSARILLERARALAGDLPIIAGGDFNVSDEEEPYRIIVGELRDSRLLAAAPGGPVGTTRDFPLDSRIGDRIDFIFVKPGIEVRSYRVLDDTYGRGRRPSDHLPVTVEVSL